MKKFTNLTILFIFMGFASCEKYFDPLDDNTYNEASLLSRPQNVEGLLMNVYANLPTDYNFNTDVMTDDAVTNNKNSSYIRMAKGEWSSAFYPGSAWEKSFSNIFTINQFLELYESVEWASDKRIDVEANKKRNALHLKRLKGEAHGLRAWYKFQLLQDHAGKATDGRLLGFPIMDTNIGAADNWELPRNTYAECVNNIIKDLDVAILNLPAVYKQVGDFITDDSFGSRYQNRMNGNAAKALKSRVALYAASPAFSEQSNMTWEQAATISGDLLVELGGLDAKGTTYYETVENKEKIWDSSVMQIRSWEVNNFPPSLFGLGRTNPSQNLVNTFPMKNGYPIDHELSGYNPDDPYANRDKRLNDYIIRDGSSFKKTIIKTFVGADKDGIEVLESSTRTGYYLKKFMNESANLVPSSTVNAPHTYTFLRETEVHLNFAEAANEAWGPDSDPKGYGFTARSIIGNLRTRAGIDKSDSYLANTISKEGMRALIKSETRLELCFEGFRFWDIRRWNDVTTMRESVEGVYITDKENTKTFSFKDVETRIYAPYMIYGPIPYGEELKYDIVQNMGW